MNDLSKCDQRIQEKMVSLAEDADEEYGRRLREGLEKAAQEGSSRKPLGAKDADKAPEEAIKKAKKSDPY